MKKKHRESDEPVIQKLHLCKVCEEVFVSKIALMDHRRLHLTCHIYVEEVVILLML